MFGARLARTAFVFLTFYAATAFGRIGETADQFSQRYGAPTDTPASQAVAKTAPLLEGAIYHVYQYVDVPPDHRADLEKPAESPAPPGQPPKPEAQKK